MADASRSCPQSRRWHLRGLARAPRHAGSPSYLSARHERVLLGAGRDLRCLPPADTSAHGAVMKVARANSNRAPIILIYGAEGRGKTTLASKFPNPLAILLERGLPRGVSIDEIQVSSSLVDVMDALRGFFADPQGYETLIIDTVDAFESVLIDGLCKKNGWKNIETPSYGKGWVIADDEWRKFLHALTAIRDKHDTTIVMTCHAAVERVDDPRAPTYTSY